MTCKEFPEAYQRLLDGAARAAERTGLREHAEHCPACAKVRDALDALDSDLRALPEVELPTSLLHTLQEIPRRDTPETPELSWTPELMAVFSLSAIGIALSVLLGILSPALQITGNLLFIATGVWIALYSILRPWFLPMRLAQDAHRSLSRRGRP